MLVEVIFKCGNKVTRHAMESSTDKVAKSKTTIGQLFKISKAASPVTDTPQEDAFYERIEANLKKKKKYLKNQSKRSDKILKSQPD